MNCCMSGNISRQLLSVQRSYDTRLPGRVMCHYLHVSAFRHVSEKFINVMIALIS